MVYLASDMARDLTGKTFLAGGGRIAEMKVVTADGLKKEDDGGLWTPAEIAEKMSAGEILLRIKARKQWAEQFARIKLLTSDSGAAVTLGDIAAIRDGFTEGDFHQ